MNSAWSGWIRITITALLSIIVAGGLLGYFYLIFGGFYRIRENRWWLGLLAIGLPFFSLTLGLIIWMIWNPLVISIFWPLLLLDLFISFILGQSVTSPYQLADWWLEFGKWLQKRKSK
jgi:hypothetical protein